MARIDALLQKGRSVVQPGDAELLLAQACDRPRSWLYAHGQDEVGAAVAAHFEALLERRIAGEPVAYLAGLRGFWSLELLVTAATLIPRPETELLVELALARIPTDRQVLVADLGTGSGAIALALASERRHAQVVATDASADALVVARANAAALGLDNIGFRRGDWLAPLAGERYDLIASNPPYIAESDPHLDQGDLRFEPRAALASGADGLDAIRVITREAPDHLRAGGWLLIEHGWQQGPAVRALLRGAGLAQVQTACDLQGHDRVSLARAPD